MSSVQVRGEKNVVVRGELDSLLKPAVYHRVGPSFGLDVLNS